MTGGLEPGCDCKLEVVCSFDIVEYSMTNQIDLAILLAHESIIATESSQGEQNSSFEKLVLRWSCPGILIKTYSGDNQDSTARVILITIDLYFYTKIFMQ